MWDMFGTGREGFVWPDVGVQPMPPLCQLCQQGWIFQFPCVSCIGQPSAGLHIQCLWWWPCAASPFLTSSCLLGEISIQPSANTVKTSRSAQLVNTVPKRLFIFPSTLPDKGYQCFFHWAAGTCLLTAVLVTYLTLASWSVGIPPLLSLLQNKYSDSRIKALFNVISAFLCVC